jgi:hypothetical protein
MTSCKCHKLHEGYFNVQGSFCVNSNSEKSDPKQPYGRCVIPSGRSSVSNILPNDENFPSGHPAVSRSFSVEDVQMSEQHRPDSRSSFSNFYTELDFSNRHCLGSFCKTSGRRGNTSERCPVSTSRPDYSKIRPDDIQ